MTQNGDNFAGNSTTVLPRFLERRQKKLWREKITSLRNDDLVNRILESGEGVLFTHRAISSDLKLPSSSSNSQHQNENAKETWKVIVVGIDEPRWNQPISTDTNDEQE